MNGRERAGKKLAALVLAVVCGASAGIGAHRAVEWYRQGEWRPTADDPVLHGQFNTRLAFME